VFLGPLAISSFLPLIMSTFVLAKCVSHRLHLMRSVILDRISDLLNEDTVVLDGRYERIASPSTLGDPLGDGS
jgi:hypothetical protein